MSLYLGDIPIANDGSHRLTGEIGDIGFAPLGIDESLNLRRYLNGQVISQLQFVPFTTKVKSAVALFPNLSTTEANWQAEKSLSKLGQCGKFVIDDENQTIRLPAVVNVKGLLSLSGIGNLVSESLPNITGENLVQANNTSGCFYGIKNASISTAAGTGTGYGTGFNASRSSSTYQNGAPVQQEAVQYPYYIQVATGIEETLPAIREYKVNNSDYFGKSMYSDIAPDNASWLVSNGSYNARSVYPDYYDWIVEQTNKGVNDFITTNFREYSSESTYSVWTNDVPPVVGMRVYGYNWSQAGGYIGRFTVSAVSGNYITFTDTISNIEKTCTYLKTVPAGIWDSAFVVNQNDQTFRLPLLNGEEDLRGSVTESVSGAVSGTNTTSFTANRNGWLSGKAFNSSEGSLIAFHINGSETCRTHAVAGSAATIEAFIKTGQTISVEFSSLFFLIFTPAVGNGTLYYFVGDTIQDASLINAGAVLGQLSNKADIDASNFNATGKETIVGWGMPDYTSGVAKNRNTQYTAEMDGLLFVCFNMYQTPANANYMTINNVVIHGKQLGGNTGGGYFSVYPLSKNDNWIFSTSSSQGEITFYPLKGVN